MAQTGLKPHHLTFGSLFKIQFAIAMVFWLVFGVAIGLAALAGMDTVRWNDTHIHGTAGLVGGLLISLLVGGLFGALGAALGSVMLKLLGPLLPLGELRSTRAAVRPEAPAE